MGPRVWLCSVPFHLFMRSELSICPYWNTLGLTWLHLGSCDLLSVCIIGLLIFDLRMTFSSTLFGCCCMSSMDLCSSVCWYPVWNSYYSHETWVLLVTVLYLPILMCSSHCFLLLSRRDCCLDCWAHHSLDSVSWTCYCTLMLISYNICIYILPFAILLVLVQPCIDLWTVLCGLAGLSIGLVLT